MQGRIKNLKDTFGFIHGDDKIDRFFMPGVMVQPPVKEFHELAQGDRVEFEHEDHARGPRAVRVQMVPCAS